MKIDFLITITLSCNYSHKLYQTLFSQYTSLYFNVHLLYDIRVECIQRMGIVLVSVLETSSRHSCFVLLKGGGWFRLTNYEGLVFRAEQGGRAGKYYLAGGLFINPFNN